LWANDRPQDYLLQLSENGLPETSVCMDAQIGLSGPDSVYFQVYTTVEQVSNNNNLILVKVNLGA